MAKKKTNVSKGAREARDMEKRLDSLIDVLEGRKPKRLFDSFDLIIATVLKSSLGSLKHKMRIIEIFAGTAK
jgi:hypothetical protein